MIHTLVAPRRLLSPLNARDCLSPLPGYLPELKPTTLPVAKSQVDFGAADRKPSARTDF